MKNGMIEQGAFHKICPGQAKFDKRSVKLKLKVKCINPQYFEKCHTKERWTSVWSIQSIVLPMVDVGRSISGPSARMRTKCKVVQ